MYPKLRIQLISEFSSELVRRVMAGDLNLALVTAPPESSRITAAAFAQTHLYAALPQTHVAAQKEDIAFQDLAKDEWILFARRTHPVVRDAIMDAAQRRASLRSTRTISLPLKKQFTWYLSTLEWQS